MRGVLVFVAMGILCVCALAETLPDGPYKECYPNGKVRMEGTVTNGLQTGVWTTYRLDGKVLSRTEFKDGKPILPPAQTLRDDKLGLTLTLPPGYQKLQSEVLPKAYAHGYLYTNWEDTTKRCTVTLEPLSQELSEHAADIEDVRELVPDDWLKEMMDSCRKTVAESGVEMRFSEPEVHIFHANWKTFRLTGFICKVTVNQVTTLNYTVQVPLKGKAIQLIIIGTGQDEKNIEALMTTLLASLDGEVSYRKSGLYTELLGRLIAYALMAGVGILIFRRLFRGMWINPFAKQS